MLQAWKIVSGGWTIKQVITSYSCECQTSGCLYFNFDDFIQISYVTSNGPMFHDGYAWNIGKILSILLIFLCRLKSIYNIILF